MDACAAKGAEDFLQPTKHLGALKGVLEQQACLLLIANTHCQMLAETGCNDIYTF